MLKINNLSFINDSYEDYFNVFIDVDLNNCNYTFMTSSDYIPKNLYSFILREIDEFEKKKRC